ncbi:MAG: hypothetical protein ACI39U_03565 [Candidatus Cryptobacteroides sp.]
MTANLKDTELFLTQYMLRYCTASGYLHGVLPETADIDEKWKELAPELCADAVREFNGYPEFCLACAGYMGMATAFFWDVDWERYGKEDYGFFRGPDGFDNMDEHILWTLLNRPEGSADEKRAVETMQSLSCEMKHLMDKSCVERGTADTYRLFLAAMGVMFKTGAGIELERLGYKFEKMR